MLNKVRKFFKNNSPDWLNTEVNQNLLQNLSDNISTTDNSKDINSASLSKGGARQRGGIGGWGDLDPSQEQVKPSLNKSNLNSDRTTVNRLQLPTPRRPHWRRIEQVFMTLDNAPANSTYNQLIEYVRATTGKGCSRKLISKWKKHRQNSDSDRPKIISTPPIVQYTQTIEQELKSVNSLQLTNNNSLSTNKSWSYFAAVGIMVSLVGCEIIPFNNLKIENIAIASVTVPTTPLPPRPEKRNRLEPRNLKIELTLSNPQDLKIKPGDKVTAGQILSDRISERNRLRARKTQLQLSLLKLNLPLTPIPQPKPIPEISPLPPVSYAEAEAAIKLHKQKLTVAERAIARQQKKIDSLKQLNAKSATGNDSKASPLLRGTEGDLKLILEHERAKSANLEAARQSAQIQLEVAQSKLTTAFEQRAYIEYQRQLEQTRRAIAVEQQQQAIASQESERERLLAEREYSQAQIEAKIQDIDYQIIQLSSVLAPYEGTIKKVKWTGQSDHNLTAVVTLAVNSDRSTIANSTDKPTPNTEAKQTTKTQP